jgi:hypothetical protein
VAADVENLLHWLVKRTKSVPMSWEGIETETEALALVTKLHEQQLRKRAAPNQAVDGDDEAREAFSLLLTMKQQRETFLEFVRVPKKWHRVKALFGSPPYSFLQPADNGALEARALGRASALASTAPSSSASEIGRGHFENDAYVLKVINDDSQSRLVPVRRALQARRVVLDVRARPPKQPNAIAKVMMPRVGERLVLRPTKPHGVDGRTTARLIVRAVIARSDRLARVYATRTS